MRMTTQASTFRIDARLQATLRELSRIVHRPMNRLVNEALELYLAQQGPQVERELEASLAALRAYRQRDPNFKTAIGALVEAEAQSRDPIEGRPVKLARRAARSRALPRRRSPRPLNA